MTLRAVDATVKMSRAILDAAGDRSIEEIPDDELAAYFEACMAFAADFQTEIKRRASDP